MAEQPVAIVTGASRGIGAATTLAFIERGYRVAMLARGQSALNQVAEQAAALGGETLVCAGDLADLDFAQSAIEQTTRQWGRIDVLVNNASWREVVTMRQISLESWEKTLRVSLTAPAFMARWAAQAMEKQQHGVIINISSMMSRQVGGLSPAYIASKGALESLTYELASLYGPSGIRVVAVNPGAIDDTGLSQNENTKQNSEQDDPEHRYAEDMIMLRRAGKPREIADTIMFLASDQASYIHATTILVDGGWSRQFLPLSLRHQQYPDQF